MKTREGNKMHRVTRLITHDPQRLYLKLEKKCQSSRNEQCNSIYQDAEMMTRPIHILQPKTHLSCRLRYPIVILHRRSGLL
jgi:hypothetical protein